MFWVSVGRSLLPPPPAEVKPLSREEAEDSHSAAPVNSHTTLETPQPREPSRHASSAWRGRAGGKRNLRDLPAPGELHPGKFFVNVELIVVN